jgi:hypothetical protein
MSDMSKKGNGALLSVRTPSSISTTCPGNAKDKGTMPSPPGKGTMRLGSFVIKGTG